MTNIKVLTDITREPIPGLNLNEAIHVQHGIIIGRCPLGTAKGNSTVMIIVPLPDGRSVVAETTMALFQNAAAILKTVDSGKGN